MFEQMMQRQRELIKLLLESSGTLPTVQEAIHGMLKESTEILDVYAPGTKPWQSREEMLSADKEAIDVLMYNLEYFILRGYTAMQVCHMFNEKHDIVTQRIETRSK